MAQKFGRHLDVVSVNRVGGSAGPLTVCACVRACARPPSARVPVIIRPAMHTV